MLDSAHADRFWSKVLRGAPDDCWNWTGETINTGYGIFRFNHADRITAHRAAWMLANARDIPFVDEYHGACVLHSCDNRLCVNPAHLSVGTQGDNLRDMCAKKRHHNSAKTHCPRGHEYTAENTIQWTAKRRCRTCEDARYLRRRAGK